MQGVGSKLQVHACIKWRRRTTLPLPANATRLAERKRFSSTSLACVSTPLSNGHTAAVLPKAAPSRLLGAPSTLNHRATHTSGMVMYFFPVAAFTSSYTPRIALSLVCR